MDTDRDVLYFMPSPPYASPLFEKTASYKQRYNSTKTQRAGSIPLRTI